MSAGEWLVRAKKVEALENELRTARNALTENKTRLDEANEKANMLRRTLQSKNGHRPFHEGVGKREQPK